MSNLKWYDLMENTLRDVAQCSVIHISKGALTEIEGESMYDLETKVDTIELKVDFEGLDNTVEILVTVPSGSVSTHDEFELRITKVNLDSVVEVEYE